MHLADEYEAARDVLTAEAAPETLPEPVEALTIEFIPVEGGVDLSIRWDRTDVRFPLRPR